jgi:drug/metabolite transporter (DMT)-like permease
MAKENFKAYLAWMAVCIVWGTTYLAIRIGVAELPPMLFAGIRWIIAGLIFLSYLRFKGVKLPVKEDIIPLAIIGILLLGFGNGLVVVGEQWISSGLAALLITTLPFWIVGFESLLPRGPRLNLFVVTGIFLGLAGVSLIFGSHWKELLEPGYLLGILAILGAEIAWSIGSVYSKYRRISDLNPLMGAAVQMLIAGTALTSLGVILGEPAEVNFTQDGLLALAYLTLVGSIFGYGSYIYAIAHLPLSLVSTYAYINPVIALYLGWLILDERLDFVILIAAVIIIAGVVLVKKGSDKQRIVPRTGDSFK